MKSLRWLIHLRIIVRKFANNYPIQRFIRLISSEFIPEYDDMMIPRIFADDLIAVDEISSSTTTHCVIFFFFFFFSRTYVPMNDELIVRYESVSIDNFQYIKILA